MAEETTTSKGEQEHGVGTRNKSDHWKEMFVDKTEDIEITLRNLGVIGMTEAYIKK